MIPIKINDLEFLIISEISILEACKYIGIILPRFCYHETLSVAGNCRICLVEIENIEKPAASCVTEIENGMTIWVNSVNVKKARENVVEGLLLNHPLDCPICDQSGECDLQDQTNFFGSDYTRYQYKKRSLEDKNCGPLIKTIMTRCIACTRCVRYGSEIAGLNFLGTLNRGDSIHIGTYVSKMFESEISANIIDLCPVGALTSKPYAFKTRPWELRTNENIDTTDSLGSNIYLNYKELEIIRILPKPTKSINQNIISDKTRFSHDYIKNNRIKNLFYFNSFLQKFEYSNWKYFLKNINLFLTTDKCFQILINDETDLILLNFLKNLNYNNLNKIKINILNSNALKNNLYINNVTDNISDINKSMHLCLFISINPKIESAVLNSRLRFKFRNKLFPIISTGLTYSYNSKANFINLAVTNILKIFEGKVFNISNFLIKTPNFLILLGKNISSRISNIKNLIVYIKKNFYSSKIIKIGIRCNSEGISYANISNINTKNIKIFKNIIACNLDDTLMLRKYFDPKIKNFIWLNTHGSTFALKSKLIIPTTCTFEYSETFLNLEQRPQKTRKVLTSSFENKSPLKILIFIFCTKFLYSYPSFFNFLNEIINNNNNNKFELNKKKMLNTFTIFSKKHLSSCLISSYPIKSNIEDFYCSSRLTKNSTTMLKCSKKIRKDSNNFFNYIN